MKLTHTITIRSHAADKTDIIEIHDDGPKFTIDLPTGAALERLAEVISKLAYTLWEKDL